VVLRYEIRALHLLNSYSEISAMPPALSSLRISLKYSQDMTKTKTIICGYNSFCSLLSKKLVASQIYYIYL
jgi:hypothetical protein